jgi:hypothetical protein
MNRYGILEAQIEIHMSDGSVVVDSVAETEAGAVRTAGPSGFSTRNLLLSEIVSVRSTLFSFQEQRNET